MNIDKLRIMQQIQIALVEKGLYVQLDSMLNGRAFISVLTTSKKQVEMIYSESVTETELQLWHDTIVYGPQVSKGE